MTPEEFQTHYPRVIGWIRPTHAGEAVYVGLVWLVLTLAFEIAFGRYVVHAPWSRIASASAAAPSIASEPPIPAAGEAQ